MGLNDCFVTNKCIIIIISYYIVLAVGYYCYYLFSNSNCGNLLKIVSIWIANSIILHWIWLKCWLLNNRLSQNSPHGFCGFIEQLELFFFSFPFHKLLFSNIHFAVRAALINFNPALNALLVKRMLTCDDLSQLQLVVKHINTYRTPISKLLAN